MMSRLFQNVPVGVWTQVSVLVFLATFLVILAWVYAPRRKSSYEDAANIPLNGGTDE